MGRKLRLEGAAAKVRVNEVEEEGGCEEESEEGDEGEEDNGDENEDGVFNIKVAITDRPVARVCRGGTKMMLVNLRVRQSKLIGVFSAIEDNQRN